jgi:two-component system, chemotaxis family, CheB/CheR fusion protein
MPDEVDESAALTLPSECHRAAGEANCPIVGIGASAGGIDALRRLFPNVDRSSGLAFIVVPHLDPDHKSMLAELLSRSTSLPVAQIENDTLAEPGHVYVIPPNASLTIDNGRLLLGAPTPPRGHRNVIDEFFTSLARDQAENAACVILSGTGSDGTVGLRAIKENGGLTLAQWEAEYDGMMRNAVSTGLVDFVLRAEEIPAKLADYFGRVDDGKRQQDGGSDPADYLAPITALLRVHTGHDFSNYKERTIVRRVQRRMHVLQIDKVPAFLDRLRRDSREVTLLFQDLLIGVTNFFRDPDAFAALEREVVPKLFQGKGTDDTIRVWVPGCATGEEAYSIAILLREFGPKSLSGPKLQIFASDIDEHALDIARIGRYPATISNDIPAQRLERHFVREDGTYRIATDLREICLFSSHNLLRDAPFSKLDLISCRNLLIYLSSELQDQVIPLFHYGLNPNGYLFLGTSENVSRNSRLFATIEKTHRIFQHRTLVERTFLNFPLPHRTRRGGVCRLDRKLPQWKRASKLRPSGYYSTSTRQLMRSSTRTAICYNPPAAPANTWSCPRRPKHQHLQYGSPRAAAGAAHGSSKSDQHRTTGHAAESNHWDEWRAQEIDLYVQPLRFGSQPEALYLAVFQDLGAVKPVVDPETLLPAEDGDESRIGPTGGRTAGQQRAAADGDGGARILERGAEIQQ